MLEAAGEALSQILSLQYLGWILLGTFVGLIVGVIPGLGGVTGMSLLLPFIYGMDAYSGLALLMGMAAVVNTSDTFPSVLIGLPGSAGSQATILDGYPMARRGEAERALGASFMSSMIGGLIGAAVLLATILIIRPVVLSLGSPELFMFALLGLAMVGLLTGGQPLSGLAVGAIGLLAGSVGAAPATTEYRFTGEILYLYDGFPIAIVALGLFAIPEMIDLLIEDRPIAEKLTLTGGRWQGTKDAWNNKFLIFRSAVLGNFVGVLPALGGAVADWLAYGFAKQTVRDSSQFGKGDIRGVIAPEAANNAKEAGTMVPTLVFGIPGSPTSAVLLGGLLLLGLRAGPDMVGAQLPVTLSVVWTLAIANLLGAAACYGMARPIAKITSLPPKVLAPCLLVLITVASYQASFNWGDILVMLGFGIVGWWWKQIGWSRAPFIIGFVLAASIERYLHLTISRYGPSFLTRPVVMVVGLLILTGIVIEVRRSMRRRGKARARAMSETEDEEVTREPT